MAGCEAQFIGMFVGIGAVFGLIGLVLIATRARFADASHRAASRGGLVGLLNWPGRSRRVAGIYITAFGGLVLLMGVASMAVGIWAGVTGAEVDCTRAAEAALQ